MTGIYKITNQVTNKSYIGQSVCIEHRLESHKNAAFNPTSNCYDRPLYCDIREYGLNNFTFEVLEKCSDNVLDEREIYYIKKI